jgi:hypothetical protein
MFQVTRFGGFSNRPKNDDQSKINALLQRVKKPQQQPAEPDDADDDGKRSIAREDSDDGSESDSGSGESRGEASSNSDSDSSSSGSDFGDSGGGDSDDDDDDGEDAGTVATEQAQNVPTVPATLNKPVTATTFEIARAMMAGTHNRVNLLRKLGPIGGAASPASSAGAAAVAASSKASSSASPVAAAATGKKPNMTTTTTTTENSGASSATAGERREARRAQREKAAAADRAAQAATWACLDPSLRNAARSRGVRQWFPVQTKALPTMVAAMRPPGDKAGGGDFCIAAPTGSGKTLAYVLPVLQTLLGRRVVRLRGLVILPTRDLALQVYGVFKAWTDSIIAQSRGSSGGGSNGLRVGLIRGQAPFTQEQAMLVGSSDGGGSGGIGGGLGVGGNLGSRVDILVATPGRLIDHLQQTPGFTLQHLRVLVIDEVDRLTRQSYQQWLGKVDAAVHAGTAADNNNNNHHFTAANSTSNGGSGTNAFSSGSHGGSGGFSGGFSGGLSYGASASAWGAVDPTQLSPAAAAAVADATAACGGDLGLLSLPATTPHRPVTTTMATTSSTAAAVAATAGNSSGSGGGAAAALGRGGGAGAWTPFTRVLVSATLTTNPQRLEEMQLRQPTIFALESSTATATAAAVAAKAAKAAAATTTTTAVRRKTKRADNDDDDVVDDDDEHDDISDGDSSDDDDDDDDGGDGDNDDDGADDDADAPKYVRVKNKLKKMFATPATLSEHMVVCRSAAERPLALLHLLNGTCVRVRACLRVPACMSVCMRVGVCVRMRARACA